MIYVCVVPLIENSISDQLAKGNGTENLCSDGVVVSTVTARYRGDNSEPHVSFVVDGARAGMQGDEKSASWLPLTLSQRSMLR